MKDCKNNKKQKKLVALFSCILKTVFVSSDSFCLITSHMWMCLPNFENLTFSIPCTFLQNYPPISILFSKKSTKFCPNWVLFTKIHLILNLGSFVSDDPHPLHRYTKFCEKRPKGWHIYVYHVNMRTLPFSHVLLPDKNTSFSYIPWYIIVESSFDCYISNSCHNRRFP